MQGLTEPCDDPSGSIAGRNFTLLHSHGMQHALNNFSVSVLEQHTSLSLSTLDTHHIHSVKNLKGWPLYHKSRPILKDQQYNTNIKYKAVHTPQKMNAYLLKTV
jgi:hypothetical protein